MIDSVLQPIVDEVSCDLIASQGSLEYTHAGEAFETVIVQGTRSVHVSAHCPAVCECNEIS